MAGTTATLEKLRGEIRCVRESILTAIVRMDDIKLQQIPQIRADYELKIGCWEQALLEAELAARRARRRCALAQAQANRGDAPRMRAIESQLDSELAVWISQVEQARIAYQSALEYLAGRRSLSKAGSRELRQLYRTLAKRLHPDVRGAHDQEGAALFLLAQSAYRDGDIMVLRSLAVATRHLDVEGDDLTAANDPESLAQELELARIEEGVVHERLRELEDGEEMRLGRLLADPRWVTARTTELRQAIEEWDRVRRTYDERLRRILEVFDG